MRRLPSGTVTLLFTDIEGSTRLLHELGAGYAEVLAEHRRVLRDAFGRHGGVEVDTQGDAFLYAFARATDAAAAAGEGQRALAHGPVRVRMGVHTGEPTLTGEGYVGADVHRAARIMSIGHGGQMLVSQSTSDLLESGVELRDLGEHRLKDLGEPQRIYQLGDGAFPPLKSLNNSNLPLQFEPLLGRKRELADLLRLVRRERVRLVTLTGPGGIGKTRLALELASELVGGFAHGVWFVDLSAVREPELVEPTIAGLLGARGDLAEHIGDRSIALVLDNFEQVVDASPAVARLLASCGEVIVVVTSREPLHVTGEREYALRPLAEAPAVELFRQRAEAASRDYEASYEELAEVCARLDSLPLAIELAAARAKTLPIGELSDRLERRLPLLSKGRRDAPERQRTLRAAIEWSYELLSSEEQRAFARLAVFAGGWTLAAAETVADVDIDTLDSLHDKSLVRHQDGRYSMLETIREYAVDQLEGTGEGHALHRRLVEFLLQLAGSAELTSDAEGDWKPELIASELANVRGALTWATEREEVELGLRLAVALEAFWVTNDPVEGSRWLGLLLERADELDGRLRARALRALGGSLYIFGEYERGTAAYEQALAVYRTIGDEGGESQLLLRLAVEHGRRGERGRQRELAEKCLDLNRRIGNRKLEAQALSAIASAEYRLGDQQHGIELMERSAELAADARFSWWQANILDTLAEWALERGDFDEAERRVRRGLPLRRRLNDRQGIVYQLATLAWTSAAQGRPARAGRLWGAVEAEEERAGRLGQWEDERERFAAAILAHADGELDEGRKQGRRLTLDEAAAEALRDA